MPIGYDNLRVNQMLVLDLQFRETTGPHTRDFAKPYHYPATLAGTPSWAVLGNDLTYLSFDSTNPDYIVLAAAACADLDFTSGDFSAGAWVYADASGNRYIFNKGTNLTGCVYAGRLHKAGRADPSVHVQHGHYSADVDVVQFRP